MDPSRIRSRWQNWANRTYQSLSQRVIPDSQRRWLRGRDTPASGPAPQAGDRRRAVRHSGTALRLGQMPKRRRRRQRGRRGGQRGTHLHRRGPQAPASRDRVAPAISVRCSSVVCGDGSAGRYSLDLFALRIRGEFVVAARMRPGDQLQHPGSGAHAAGFAGQPPCGRTFTALGWSARWRSPIRRSRWRHADRPSVQWSPWHARAGPVVAGRTWLRVLAENVGMRSPRRRVPITRRPDVGCDPLEPRASIRRTGVGAMQLARKFAGQAISASPPAGPATQPVPAPRASHRRARRISDRERAELLLLGMPYRDIGAGCSSQRRRSSTTSPGPPAAGERGQGVLSMLRAMLA